MYYCNCFESWKVKGVKIPAYTEAYGVYRYQEVKVDSNEYCIHCGYAAFYSKGNPETAENKRGPKVKLNLETA